MWVVRALALALALGLTACRGAGPTMTAPMPQASAAVRPSPGCSSPDASVYDQSGRSQVREIAVDGGERSYRVYVPSSASPQVPAPIVYNFHGLGSNALEQEVYSGLVPLAEEKGFVLVSPDGAGVIKGWHLPGLPVEDPERDLRFFDALHAYLLRSLCLDEGRVYATGMSNGAFFASALACRRWQVVAAIAPVAGVFYPRAGCEGPVPILAFHGTQDAIVPYGPGLIFNIIPYEGAEAYVERWARTNGCQGSPRRERLGREVTRLFYGGCKAATELVVVEGGGHTWPGAVDVPRLGLTTQEVSAARLMWDFFAPQRSQGP